ncbi:hypothetical protein EVAR_60428_1 [Eumeta japonica]|uniref:Uncharacterized protein n=1 Tax=Eumeta variegata TaxID=151549 RepID=A0A4C1ZL97_EUMVA|nr:hypothetical protein EVAR_60428_1 [Eumeta japonica]
MCAKFQVDQTSRNREEDDEMNFAAFQTSGASFVTGAQLPAAKLQQGVAANGATISQAFSCTTPQHTPELLFLSPESIGPHRVVQGLLDLTEQVVGMVGGMGTVSSAGGDGVQYVRALDASALQPTPHFITLPAELNLLALMFNFVVFHVRINTCASLVS